MYRLSSRRAEWGVRNASRDDTEASPRNPGARWRPCGCWRPSGGVNGVNSNEVDARSGEMR